MTFSCEDLWQFGFDQTVLTMPCGQPKTKASEHRRLNEPAAWFKSLWLGGGSRRGRAEAVKCARKVRGDGKGIA